MGAYEPLFSILVEHPFFSDRRCRNLAFIPTDTCMTVMENTGLIMKKDINGIHVLCDLDRLQSLRLYIDDPTDPLSLCFKVYANDPLFFNYTDLPAFDGKRILYFDNRRATDDSTDLIILNTGHCVSEKDLVEPSVTIKTILSTKDAIVRPVCIVNICAKDEKKTAYLLDQKHRVAAKNYAIRFDTRKTLWRYYLLGTMRRENLYIADPNNKTEFETPRNVALPGNRSALCFTSTSAIPLTEVPSPRFQLKEKNSGKGKVIIKWLPGASAGRIHRDRNQTNSEILISEIFINC
jgi:hypothetical protein